MTTNRRWWPPTRATVIYVIVMLCLYLGTEALGVFGHAASPVQNVLGLVLLLAVLPAGLVLLPLWFVLFVATGAYLGNGATYIADVMIVAAVLLNACFVNWMARRRQRSRTARRQPAHGQTLPPLGGP